MKKIRVLVVEDEPVIAADLEDRLTEMGFEVAGLCSSGEAALAMLETPATVDMVLMDIQLEGALDGIQTAGIIRQKQSLPLIFLTSNADEATFSRALATAPAAFLSKPFRGKDLRHAIELAIARVAAPAPEEPSPSKEDRSAFLFNDRIFIKVKDRMIRIFLEDILWIEADDYYCKLATREKEYLITQTLKQIGEMMVLHPSFMRVHRSYIVNLMHVEEIGDLSVIIQKKLIPLNRNSKEELTARLYKL
jgi:DNA-binding LytR/AlgR family response regulator